MRRFWLGLGLMAGLLAAGLFLSVKFRQIHAPMAEKLTRAAEAAREANLSAASAWLEDAWQDWENARKFSASVTDHGPMEEMEGLFAEARYFGQTGDPEELAAACGRLAALSRAMAQSQTVNWWSLL